MRYHLTLVKMAKISKTGNRSVGKDVEKGEPFYTVGGNVGAATLESSMEVPQKVKNRTTLNPAIALLGIYPKDTEVVKRRSTCTLMFITAMSTVTKL